MLTSLRIFTLLPLIGVSVLLNGCIGSNVRQTEMARYDLGALPASTEATALPLSLIDIEARPWLVTNAMQYRLSYVDASRRYSFADSQWVTPPAELMERHLTRRLVFPAAEQNTVGGVACRLRLGVDEIVQNFDSPATSRVTLEVHATLLPSRGEIALARRAFQVQAPAPSADAAGGVKATRDAVQKLGSALNLWLQEIATADRSKAAVEISANGPAAEKTTEQTAKLAELCKGR